MPSSQHPPSVGVLIVDDQASFRNAAAALIDMADGFHVSDTVRSGAAAIERCRRGGVDLVLMDVNMPGMGGIEAANRIRADSDTVVVLVSTYAPDDLPADLSGSGCPYVQKARLATETLDAIWATARPSGDAEG